MLYEVITIRINLRDKSDRKAQSHTIALRLRKGLEEIARRNKVRLKIVETPPGPPVIATLTAEVYAAPDVPHASQLAAADRLAAMLETEPLVVDVDTSAEARRERIDFVLDKTKAALHGITAQDAAATLALALGGMSPATVHEPFERQPLFIRLVLPRAAMADESVV